MNVSGTEGKKGGNVDAGESMSVNKCSSFSGVNTSLLCCFPSAGTVKCVSPQSWSVHALYADQIFLRVTYWLKGYYAE